MHILHLLIPGKWTHTKKIQKKKWGTSEWRNVIKGKETKSSQILCIFDVKTNNQFQINLRIFFSLVLTLIRGVTYAALFNIFSNLLFRWQRMQVFPELSPWLPDKCETCLNVFFYLCWALCFSFLYWNVYDFCNRIDIAMYRMFLILYIKKKVRIFIVCTSTDPLTMSAPFNRQPP